MAQIAEIAPVDLNARINRGETPCIIDVREPDEVAFAPMPHAMHIPMGEIAARVAELDPDRETVIVCHHGIRSAQVAMYLLGMGFERVLNLSGGIDAWSLEVDSSIPRY